MVEYLVSVVAVSMLIGILSYASYPGGSERAVKFAASILLLYTAAAPLLSVVGELSHGDAPGFKIEAELPDFDKDAAYVETAEEAFKQGICKLLYTKYSINADEIMVRTVEFEFESMKAKKIIITLSGDAVFLDLRGIADYVTGLGLGDCEVNVTLG